MSTIYNITSYIVVVIHSVILQRWSNFHQDDEERDGRLDGGRLVVPSDKLLRGARAIMVRFLRLWSNSCDYGQIPASTVGLYGTGRLQIGCRSVLSGAPNFGILRGVRVLLKLCLEMISIASLRGRMVVMTGFMPVFSPAPSGTGIWRGKSRSRFSRGA